MTKTYKIEIDALFIRDIKADNKEEEIMFL